MHQTLSVMVNENVARTDHVSTGILVKTRT